ncbi:MAG TPA: hypothetical protein VFG68_20345 [Fimbriiglobus sp.]|nr:hypothetical protein [Fimbriiglobus sp.]
MPDDPTARFAPDEPAPAKAGPARPAGWRADTPGAAGNRTVPAVLSLLALLAIAGVLVGVIIYWLRARPEPRFVSVPVGEYDDPAWPVNPWANQDARRLADCFPGRPEPEFTAQQQDKFRTLLARLADRDADSARPLVLHVTALGAVHDRTVYLLPGLARPGDPSSWIAVEELLDKFDKAAADRGKLLVLDLAHPTADPFAGVLRDEVSDRLHDLLTGRPLPFPVLTSCGPGEQSLPADAERCSGFAFYLAEGLRGAADRDRDDGVTLPELTAFLAGRVSRWARLVHDRPQTPRLYGPADRGPVFHVPSPPPAQTEQPAPDPYPQWLIDGWRLRDEQRTAGAGRDLPDPFARLTAGLVRAEREWLRSGNAARAERIWGAAASDWQKAQPVSGRPDRSADVFAKALAAAGKYRLAIARRGRPAAPPDWAPALDRYLDAKRPADPGKPDETGKLLDEWVKLVKPEGRLDAVGLLWDRFRLVPPTVERTRACVAALDAVKADREYAETVLLRSLAAWEYRRQAISEYPQRQVVELLRAEEELSKTLALGPNGFELIAGRLDKALEAYRVGQKGLFHGPFQEVKQAEGQLKEAADGFAAARQELAARQEADRVLDNAVMVLLDTMPSVLTAPQPEFDRWVNAARDATAKNVTGLSERLPVVDDPFAVPPGKKEPDPLPPRTKPADLLRFERLVAGTALPADSRRKAWDVIRADRRKFHDAAREQDAADDAAKDRTTNPTPAAETDRIGEAKLAVRRARESVELLKLAGYAKAGELDAALGRLERDPASDAEPLGRLLRKAWAEGLPETARVVPPGATRARPMPKAPAGVIPAARAAAGAYRKWVRDQLLAGQPLRHNTAATDKFYETVRQDFELSPD